MELVLIDRKVRAGWEGQIIFLCVGAKENVTGGNHYFSTIKYDSLANLDTTKTILDALVMVN